METFILIALAVAAVVILIVLFNGKINTLNKKLQALEQQLQNKQAPTELEPIESDNTSSIIVPDPPPIINYDIPTAEVYPENTIIPPDPPTDSDIQVLHKKSDSSAFSDITDLQRAKSFIRFMARFIDCSIEAIIYCLLIMILCSYMTIFIVIVNFLLHPMTILLFVILIDSLLYAICGNTPGKILLGIKVIEKDGSSINGKRYLLRNILVWGEGLFGGVAIMYVITQLYQFIRIQKKNSTTYDEKLNMACIKFKHNIFERIIIASIILIGFITYLIS